MISRPSKETRTIRVLRKTPTCMLVKLFDSTSRPWPTMSSSELTFRGSIMDELMRRNPRVFEDWVASDEPSPTPFFMLGNPDVEFEPIDSGMEAA